MLYVHDFVQHCFNKNEPATNVFSNRQRSYVILSITINELHDLLHNWTHCALQTDSYNGLEILFTNLDPAATQATLTYRRIEGNIQGLFLSKIMPLCIAEIQATLCKSIIQHLVVVHSVC